MPQRSDHGLILQGLWRSSAPMSLMFTEKKKNLIVVSLCVHSTDSRSSQRPLWGTLDPSGSAHTCTNTHESMKEWMRARKMRERDSESDTLTLPLILLRCVGFARSASLPLNGGGSFQSAFNPIIKLVMVLWTHSPLTGECAHAGLTNSDYVRSLLTLCEHI